MKLKQNENAIDLNTIEWKYSRMKTGKMKIK